MILTVTNLNPVPASRPRVTRWGTYYAKTYKNWRVQAHDVIPVNPGMPLEGNLSVDLKIIVTRPKTTKRRNPRGDIDNYAKAILDAITGEKKNPKGWWNDDDQITELNLIKRFAFPDEEPGYQISITEIED